MKAITNFRFFARKFGTSSKLVVRQATLRDADIITRRTVHEGWHIGPYDFRHYISFDPESFFIGEIGGEIAAHFGIIKFPNHYSGGGLIITDKYRRMGIASRCYSLTLSVCSDKSLTVGGDGSFEAMPILESLGFRRYWDTYGVKLSFEKVAKIITSTERFDSFVKPLNEVDLNKLLLYDQCVFGTERNDLMQRWINTPGSFGWAAIDKITNDITGYTVLKQAIRGGGTEIGMAMAPLYADNADVVKLLIKCAADECLKNPAIPKTKLEIVHPVGDSCGEEAAELMSELDAELIHIACRVYTNGVSPGRQMRKIYGIVSPTCD